MARKLKKVDLIEGTLPGQGRYKGLPCPFCGYKRPYLTRYSADTWDVSCPKCGASIELQDTKDDAWGMWNGRAIKLLPCPVCGESEIEIETQMHNDSTDNPTYRARCKTCGLTSGSVHNQEELYKVWNCRATEM